MKPAASFSLTAAPNRVTVSFTEYLLGLVISPSSTACAVAEAAHIASRIAKVAGARFLRLMGIPQPGVGFAGSDATAPTRYLGRVAYHRRREWGEPSMYR